MSRPTKATNPNHKSIRILLGVLVVYGVLVATHDGEFWPFSIFPMFSSAGQPWTRALVRDVPYDASDTLLWAPRTLETLPGRAVTLDEVGVSQNDLSVFLERTHFWTPERRQTLTALLQPHVPS